jgi:hypothetical protein
MLISTKFIIFHHSFIHSLANFHHSRLKQVKMVNAPSSQQPTLLDEIANFLECTNEQVRHRLMCQRTHERVYLHFRQRLLLTNYKDRNNEYRSLIFEGLTFKGADKLSAHGQLRYPFNSKVSQYFFDRHNIRLKYPFHPCVVYTNYGRHNREFYPLELVRLMSNLPPIPSQLPPKPPRANDGGDGDDDEHIYATPFEVGKQRSK